jgi:peptide/nickel transport system permease protein
VRALRFARTPTGAIGLAILALILLVALAGPLFAPHSPTKSIGIPGSGPSADAVLGTDFLGRDVYSRLLWGGRSVLGLAGLATVIAYAAGGVVGLVAGYSRNVLDGLLMRLVDVLLAFPPLLVLLVVIAGAGTSLPVLVLAVALVQLPGIARLVRSLTLEASGRGYVEAAVVRGESTAAILRREIIPSIAGPLSADLGLRMTFSILLIAGANFLSLGLQPPAADWALMIAENRDFLELNPWAVAVPAALIAALTVGLSFTGDAVARMLGRSDVKGLR